MPLFKIEGHKPALIDVMNARIADPYSIYSDHRSGISSAPLAPFHVLSPGAEQSVAEMELHHDLRPSQPSLPVGVYHGPDAF